MRRAHHRRRHHSGRHGDDGPAGDPRRRGIRPCRLSARRRGAADRRARRAAGRGRSSARSRRRTIARRMRRRDLPRVQFRRRAAVVLGRPQGGLSGGRPHLARLLLHGRHHPARQAAAGAAPHAGTVGEIRAARRQCVSCRRRQSASADPLRRQQAGRTRARRSSSAPIFCGSASRSAACSPASMASASRSAI